MKRLIFSTILAIIAIPANATIISFDLLFDDADWSGSASFDDTTGVAWGLAPSFTSYQILTMEVSQAGVATWDESEQSGPGWSETGVLVDSTGKAALFTFATDTATSLELMPRLGIGGTGTDYVILSTAFTSDSGTTEYGYSAMVPVPEPAPLSLLLVGLLGIGAISCRPGRRAAGIC